MLGNDIRSRRFIFSAHAQSMIVSVTFGASVFSSIFAALNSLSVEFKSHIFNIFFISEACLWQARAALYGSFFFHDASRRDFRNMVFCGIFCILQ